MTGCVIWAIVIFLGAFGVYFATHFTVRVPSGHVGWDGETVHQPGEYRFFFHRMTIIDVGEQITTFGDDVLGITQVLETHRLESGSESYFMGKSGNYQRRIDEVQITKAPKNIKNKQIIVWKPDESQVRKFLRAGDIPPQLANLLRTVPTVDLAKYAALLGVQILWIDTLQRRQGSGVFLGDDVEIPY